MIEEWYIEEIVPRPKWMKKCYSKSFLTPEEAISMLNEMERVIGMNFFNSLVQYYQEKQNRIDKINARKEKLSEEGIQRQKEIKKERKQLIKKKMLNSITTIHCSKK